MAPPERIIPLSQPSLGAAEREAVLGVLGGSQLSLGPNLGRFEQQLAAYAGVDHAVAVNSGTSGLHLCVKAAGIGAGDEVVTTPFSFVASANCILYEQGVPVFVDIDPSTFNLDPRNVEAAITPRTKAILAVDIFGLPAEMDSIRAIARRYNLWVIEDACEAIGATYRGQRAGGLGDCGVFAFYPNKQLTTAEGGAVLTNSERVADLCRSLRNHGRDKTDLAYYRLGYNYRLSELHCALGVAQLNRLGELLAERTAVAEAYQQRLKGLPVESLQRFEGLERSWYAFIVLVEEALGGHPRDALLQRLRRRGVGCSNYFPALHLQPFYARAFGYAKGRFPIAESIAARTVALPFYAGLPLDSVEYVVDCLAEELEELSPSKISL